MSYGYTLKEISKAEAHTKQEVIFQGLTPFDIHEGGITGDDKINQFRDEKKREIRYIYSHRLLEGDEKRWKRKRSSVYCFLLFLFSFFLHATLAAFQILNMA
jgi:hypothetical protein